MQTKPQHIIQKGSVVRRLAAPWTIYAGSYDKAHGRVDHMIGRHTCVVLWPDGTYSKERCTDLLCVVR